MIKKLLTLAFLISSGFSFSQETFWKKETSTQKNISKNEMLNLPQKNIYTLDIKAFQKKINNSLPVNSKMSNIIINLPNSKGKIESYRIYENPTMSPELQVKYPAIKSYIGININSPSSKSYISISHLGLKAMTFHDDQTTTFIEPLSLHNQKYSVYCREDKEKNLTPFECNLISHSKKQLKNNSIFQKNANDATLRTYRLAMSATGEYTAFFGGTKADALAAINETMTRVNGIFEQEFAVRMILISNTDEVIYTDKNTDPYSNNDTKYNKELSSTLDKIIGPNNYDIGHLVSAIGNNGNAGCIGCVCLIENGTDLNGNWTTNDHKGSGFTTSTTPTGDNFDVDFVAHEIGHQFGANHTFSFRKEGTGVNVEPGSGSTIMGYAGITSQDIQAHSDPFFHAKSIEQITNYIKSTNCQTDTSTGNNTPTANAGIDYTIPKNTPFMLTGNGTDIDPDHLTYSWEQIDDTDASYTDSNSGAFSNKLAGPIFRSYPPSSSPTRYFPKMESILNGSLTTQGNEITVEALPSVNRTLNFRFTTRDNKLGGAANNSDDMKVKVTTSSEPFIVTSQLNNPTYLAGSTQTVTWNVAGTKTNGINCSKVDILWSDDYGLTWTTLLNSVINDGVQEIIIPTTTTTHGRIMVKGHNHIFFNINESDITVINNNNDTTPPSPPINLVSSDITSNSVKLSWDASTDNVEVIEYIIFKDNVVLGTSNNISYTVNNLTASTNYSFKVKAKDAAGNTSNESNIENITTLDVSNNTNGYCISKGLDTNDERIKNVQIGDINKTSNGISGYEDFTNLETSLTKESNYSITITPFWTNDKYNEGYAIFIDYNQDGDFEDSGETVWTQTPTVTSSVTGNFQIPSTAKTGKTRIRISMKYDGIPTSCEVFDYGQVEDYTINILDKTTTNNLTYCESKGNSTEDEKIAKVILGQINHPTTSSDGYENHTNITTNLQKGTNYTITIFPEWTTTSYNEGYAVYIDYNQDGDFIDSNEKVLSISPTNSLSVTNTFTIPISAKLGATRMRVAMKYDGIPDPCETFDYGQVEDYSVYLISSSRNDESEIQLITDINLFPNPAKSVLNISNIKIGSSFSIYNLLGQNIKEGIIQNNSIDLSSIPKGNYFLEINYKNTRIKKPFIKE